MIRVGLIVLSLAALSDSFAASARPAGRQIVSRSARNTPVVQCGAVFSRNTSFMSSDEDDYWVTVNASQFTLVATRYGISPSSWSCDPSVEIVAAPDGQGDWAPIEHEYGDGDSFNFTVGPWDPPATSADVFFSGGLCDYVLTMENTEIVCPGSDSATA